MKISSTIVVIVLLLSLRLQATIPHPQLLIFYGCSCAGKSTLAWNLKETLGEEWQYLDWDVYADQLGDEKATEALVDAVMEELAHDRCVIVDAQPCVDQTVFLSQTEIAITVILVYASLPVLIARDKARQAVLQRPEQRWNYAKAYIYDTYSLLYGPDGNYDCIDCIKCSDIECSVVDYPVNEATQKLFKNILQAENDIPIYAKISCDIIVRTDKQSISENIDFIKMQLAL